MRRRHAAFEHRLGAGAVLLLGQQQRDQGAFGVPGPEKRQPVHMVPVQVREQDRAGERPAAQQRGDLPQAGPGVEDERRLRVVVVGDGHAGGVTAVAEELGSWRRGRSAGCRIHAPEVRPARQDRSASSRRWPPDSSSSEERSNWPASTAATRQAVTAISEAVRTPPSRWARSPQDRARPVLRQLLAVSLDPDHAVQDQEDIGARLALFGERGAGLELVDPGLGAPCISCTDSERSSAVSTAVTSAGESSSPRGCACRRTWCTSRGSR